MAKRIFEMSQHMADLIAAGEVVERPASVVKELAENAIDAGAMSLTIEIKDGGMTYIRVTDDGCGISPEDAARAFLRHATSKLREEKDLQRISTLGFRGEALAAISAVSRMEMFSREKGAGSGTHIALEGGKIVEEREAGCPEGTSMIVRDLFFNTPARLKFMKKDSAEGAAVSAAAARTALSHPEVAVRYIRDGKEELRSPGGGKLDACVYAVLGREFSVSAMKVEAADGEMTLRGLVSAPGAARGNRAQQYFFVNGRFVRSPQLQSALEQAYKNELFTGRFPACVLYLDIEPSMLDVNVHPAKTEIKFLNEHRVFDLVYYGVRGVVDGTPRERTYVPPRVSPPVMKVSDSAAATLPAVFFPPAATAAATVRPDAAPPAAPAAAVSAAPAAAATVVPDAAPPEVSAPRAAAPEQPAFHAPVPAAPTPEAYAPRSEPAAEAPASYAAPVRILGEAFKKYILAEQGGRLVVIDKHAAHERLLFDALKAADTLPASQLLLAPVTAPLGREEKELLLRNRALIEELGFAFEDYSPDCVAVTETPQGIAESEIAPVLAELCEDIRLRNRPGALPLRDELLASVACRAAVKAGRESDDTELLPLAEAVISGKIKYCPHGRPVAQEFTEHRLDKLFKRE